MSNEFYRTSECSSLVEDTKILEQHHDYVESLSNTVRQLYASRTPFRLYHGPSYNLRTGGPKRAIKKVDISHLNRVVHVNASKRTVLVEPGATMADVVSTTLFHGLMPAVVLEFPGITCGSAFATNGTSSSSFREGTFEDTVVGIEVVLGNGDIIPKATPSGHHADLFWGCAGGFGSLGVVTMLEIELVPATPYVQLSYLVCEHRAVYEAIEREMGCDRDAPPNEPPRVRRRSQQSTFSKRSQDAVDLRPQFIDAVAFRGNLGVVVVGRLVGSPDDGVRIRRFSHKSDPYFYSHLTTVAESASAENTDVIDLGPGLSPYVARCKMVDAIALPDYLFRYDRGVFFAGGDRLEKHAYARSPILRSVTSRLFGSSRAIQACKRSGLDAVMSSFTASVPFPQSPAALEQLGQELDVWPMWLCPAKISPRRCASWSQRYSGTKPEAGGYTSWVGGRIEMTIGCFGLGRAKNASEQMEAAKNAKCRIRDLLGDHLDAQGVALTAAPLDNEAEFGHKYDERKYEGLRRKYAAESLPSIKDKVGVLPKMESPGSMPSWALQIATAVCAICHSE